MSQGFSHAVVCALIFFLAGVVSIVVGGSNVALPVAGVGKWTYRDSKSLPQYAFDGNSSTSWTSNACRAGGWRVNPALNPIFRSCDAGLCVSSCDANRLNSSTDQNPYTAGTAPFSHAEGRAWIVYSFPSGALSGIVGLYLRGLWPADTLLYGISADGSSLLKLATIQPDSTYLDINLPGPFPALSGLRLEAASEDGVMRGYCYANVGDCKSITVTDIAVQASSCYDELTADLGTLRTVSYATARFGGFVDGAVFTSVDGTNFIRRVGLQQFAQSSNTVTIPFPGSVVARYVKFR
jgi:hypothetical protein